MLKKMLKKTTPLYLATLLLISFTPQPLWGHGHITRCRPQILAVSEKNRPRAEHHLKMGLEAFNAQHWQVAARHLTILTRDFHSNFYPADVHYSLGLSFYQLNELDLANQQWSIYLQKETEPGHLNDVMQAKLDIAERCRRGACGRLFGIRALPKWSNGDTLALNIYDEIIATLPTSDLAATSLIGRGHLFSKQGSFQEAIESLSLMIKRFPQHELTPVAYLAMQEVYLAKARVDGQNPDTLPLAEVALKRFASCYPKDDRLQEAYTLFATIRDVQANSFYQTALFYIRTKKPHAAILYCKATLRQFPDTPTAQRCRATLARLGPCALLSEEPQTPQCPEDMPASTEDMPISEEGIEPLALCDD